MPAFTLGGTVSGGGNQINNVIIGTSTPLAGSFTTLSASSTSTLTGNTTIGAGSGSPQLKLSGAASSTANNGAQLAFAAAGTPYAYISNVAWLKGGGSTDNNLAYWTDAGLGHYFYANNNATTAVATITSTGLAVTGTLSATTTGQVGTTLGVGNATPSASGTGITFPATQSASSDANTLDDYEEGTWTPGVSFGGGTTGITYTAQDGRYTKIGRQVTVTANVTLSSKGSSTGDAVLTGLPFTNDTARSAGSIYSAQITFADFLSILVEASNTIAYFRETTNAGVATDLTNADFANNSNWTATITYFV
jgi:hypothetical protein